MSDLKLFYNAQGGLDLTKMRTNGTLKHEDYIQWDSLMLQTVKEPLFAISDLVGKGLVKNVPNLSYTVSKYQKVSEMTAASVTMGGSTKSDKDILTFSEAGVPIPIFRKDFTIGMRDQGQDGTVGAESLMAASRVVGEAMEDMAWNGTGIIVDDLQVYGYTNHPDRNTYSVTNAWGGGSEDPVADIQAMIKLLYLDGFIGKTFTLYVSSDNWGFIDGDYSSVKGEKTYKQRFEALSAIDEVKLGTGLADGELVLVYMNPATVDLAVAQNITSFEQPSTDRFVSNFTVFSAMAIRVKSDKNGTCGVVHATGA